MRSLPWLAVALLALSCSNPTASDDGGPNASSVTKTVGPDGATIEVGGATVTIPRGALTTPVDITIAASNDGPPEGFVALSKVFTCGPSGTTFAEPVVMSMPFTDDGQPSTMWWSTGADPTFKDVGGEASGGMMSATVRHFSSGFVGRRK